MKKILCLIALVAMAAASFTGCKNQPPFVKLAESVDSVNAFFAGQPEQTAPSARLQYDEVTNTVKIEYTLPSEQIARLMQDNIGLTEDVLLNTVLPEAPYSLMANAAEAGAAVMIVYSWKPDGHAEYLIEGSRVKAAYDASKDKAGAE